jgi:hypothetical protein
MTDRDCSERPDCQQIIEDKHLWALDRHEFDFVEELGFIKKHKNNNLFVYSMITSKLESNN